MATYYWVNGNGSLTQNNNQNLSFTEGGPGGNSINLTADDDVVFSSSGNPGTYTVSIGNVTIYILMVLMGVSGITFNRTGTLTVRRLWSTHGASFTTTGGGTLAIGGAGTQTFGIEDNGNFLGNVSLVSDVIQIETYGANFPTFGNLNINTTYSHSGGTLDVSTLTIGSNAVISSPGQTRFRVSGGLINIDASAQIPVNTGFDITAPTCTFNGGGKSLGSLTITDTTYSGNNAIGLSSASFSGIQISLKPGGGTRKINFNSNIQAGTISVTGSSDVSRVAFIASQTRTIGGSFSNQATVRADFMNINSSAGWNFPNGGDCGGNNNITFPEARTVYRVSAGQWITSSPMWSTTSGGIASNNANPRAHDTAVIDNNSGSSITFNDYYIKNIVATARTSAFNLFTTAANNIRVLGDLDLGSGVNVVSSQNYLAVFEGSAPVQNFSTVNAVTNGIQVSKTAGEFRLNSDYEGGTISCSGGQYDFINTDNYIIQAASCIFSNTGVVDLGDQPLEITATSGTAFSASPGNTNNFDEVDIILSGDTTAQTIFAGGGHEYKSLVISGSSSSSGYASPLINGDNKFGTLTSTRSTDYRVQFGNNSIQEIESWDISGSPSHTVYLAPQAAGQFFSLVFTGPGIVQTDYLNITMSNATPSANTWYAGNNSIDGGNNTGWLFNDPMPPSSDTNFLIFFND